MSQQQQPRDIVYTPPEVSTLVVSAIDERRKNPGAGVRFGLAQLDAHLLPLRPGELVTVLGRPSNYKSGLMQFWARKIARDILEDEAEKEMVVYATWEMAIEELGLYDLAAATSLSASDISQGHVNEAAWEALLAAAMRRAGMPIWIIGHSIERRKKRPRLTLSNIGQALLWVEREMGYHPRAVFLDYLQQMEPEERPNTRNREGTRRMDIFENVYRCKDMALALGCPVILGVQARREVDDRPWKLPQLGDGMESSNIEHTSDKMLSVWMPKTSETAGEPLRGARELTVNDNLLLVRICKQKMGPAGQWMALHVDPGRNEISSFERAAEAPAYGQRGWEDDDDEYVA